MSAHKAYFLGIYLLFGSLIELQAQAPFVLNGDILQITDNCYQFQHSSKGATVGNMWHSISLNLEHAFEINVALHLGCNRAAGEGMAFVLHADSAFYDQLGCAGAALGFGNNFTCKGIQPSLALEIDTRFNYSISDNFQPHFSLVQDGRQSSPLIDVIPIRNQGKDIRDCEYHDLCIKWSPSTEEFSVFLDDKLYINYQKDLRNTIFKGAKEIYFGFTGSVNKHNSNQSVCVQSVRMELDEKASYQKSFEEAIGIYPNDFNERLTIDISLEKERYVQLQLYNSKGEVVYEIPNHAVRKNKYFFNLPGLPSGIYYVTVTDGTNSVSQKIVHISTVRA